MTANSEIDSDTQAERPDDHCRPQGDCRDGIDHLIVTACVTGSQIARSHDLLLLNPVPFTRDVDLFIPTGWYYCNTYVQRNHVGWIERLVCLS